MTNNQTASRQALEALIEASGLFYEFPELYEMIGTHQVIHNAINRLMKEVTQ